MSSIPKPGYEVFPLVYVLELENERYYVGITYNLNLRLAQHWAGEGAVWTRSHPPLKLLEVHQNRTEEDVTLDMMLKYGYERVRGGPWTQMTLKKPPLKMFEYTRRS